MGMREVRVYDGNSPTIEQVVAGDPAARFPKEIWLAQMHPGQFAVRYKDFWKNAWVPTHLFFILHAPNYVIAVFLRI